MDEELSELAAQGLLRLPAGPPDWRAFFALPPPKSSRRRCKLPSRPSVRKIDAFWDSSALAPLCASQHGSPVARAALKSKSVAVWWGTPVEMLGDLHRLARDGGMSRQDFDRASRRLAALRRQWAEVLPAARVRDLAELLLQRHPLRAADAFQLAAALVWSGERPRKRAFVCFDHRLAEAAVREGFQVEADSGSLISNTSQ